MRQAIEKVGGDGNGKGGLVGYLENVARTDPSFMAQAFIRSTVPPARDDPAEANVGVLGDIRVFSVPPGHFLSLEEARGAYLERHPDLAEQLGEYEVTPPDPSIDAEIPEVAASEDVPTFRREPFEPPMIERDPGAEIVPLHRKRDRDDSA